MPSWITRSALRFDAAWAAASPRARWLAAGAWYAFIFALSQSPGTDVDSTGRVLDLFDLADFNGLFRLSAHLFVFGVMGALVYGSRNGGFGLSRSAFAEAMAGNAVLALGDELHQGLVANRHARMVDVAADVVGGLVAVLLLIALVSYGRRRHTLE